MAELRDHVQAMGLGGVATFIASGNVVFDDPGVGGREALEARMEDHLQVRLGFFTDVIIRTLSEVSRLTLHTRVAAAPEEGFTVHVLFGRSDLVPGTRAAFQELEGPDDRFHVVGREVLWLRRGRLSDSALKQGDLTAAFGGVAHTARKVDTLRRLVERFGSG
mgnify:FL=1